MSQSRRMSVWLHEQRASVMPFGAPDQRTAYSPGRIAVETSEGRVVAERLDPRSSFLGHGETTPWDPLHRAYFNGYALWCKPMLVEIFSNALCFTIECFKDSVCDFTITGAITRTKRIDSNR